MKPRNRQIRHDNQVKAMPKRVIMSAKAPKPIGAYSQGVVSNGLIFTSGQGAIDSRTNNWLGGDIKQQTRITMDNVKAILEEGGSSLDKVLKITIFLKEKNLFGDMNAVYANYFPKDPPARSTVVTDLPREDMLVEIEAIASV